MKNTLLTIGWLCFMTKLLAQVPQSDSLRLWFSVVWDDSSKIVKIQPNIQFFGQQSRLLHYQIRITDASLRPGTAIEKQKGTFLALPFDTITVLEKIIAFQPENDFNFNFYVLDGDFVLAWSAWNFDDNFAVRKQQKPKLKPAPTFLANDNFEIDALVFNETRTPFGKEFFRLFSERWQAPPNVSGYWITFRENLTPGRNSLLSVSMNNRELFSRYLIPRRDFMETLAQQTADYLLSLLQNGNFEGGLTNEDLFGVGID